MSEENRWGLGVMWVGIMYLLLIIHKVRALNEVFILLAVAAMGLGGIVALLFVRYTER